jgi:predicted metal-dependent hydrolase
VDPQKKDRLFQNGLEAFNSGHFYEAHEHWEEVWLETRNPEKMFLQGLIQVAAAYHHYSRENNLGCRNLLRAGLLKLEGCPPESWGLAIEPLRTSVRQWLVPLHAGESPNGLRIPRIQPHGKQDPSAETK